MNLLELLIFMLPAYIANSAPVVFGGRGPPIDLNAKLEKNRILGKSKTIIGFISGIVLGTASGIILMALPYFQTFSIEHVFAVSFLLSCGAMGGDILGSFIKRRMGLKEGQKSVVMDRILFAIIALLFVFAYAPKLYDEFTALGVLFVIVVTFFLHRIANFLAHKANIKRVPW